MIFFGFHCFLRRCIWSLGAYWPLVVLAFSVNVTSVLYFFYALGMFIRKRGSGLVEKLIDELPVELHLPGYNYSGPGMFFCVIKEKNSYSYGLKVY